MHFVCSLHLAFRVSFHCNTRNTRAREGFGQFRTLKLRKSARFRHACHFLAHI
jgi:hypothetical protein